jgi:hypothetical protein
MTGPTGIQGEVGPQGLAGFATNTGCTGPQGDIGPQGPMGIQGEIGPTGSFQINGILYSDYIYWDNNSKTYMSGSTGVHIGGNAGNQSQGIGAIAIGYNAGSQLQGMYSVAVGNGAGQVNQHSNTIIINADQSSLNSTSNNSLYINPIRTVSDNSLNPLTYDIISKEITYNTAKSFVINHPDDNNKYLIHACLEGPEVGVYYRGQEETVNGWIEIILPNYVKNLAGNFTVLATVIYDDEKPDMFPILKCSKIQDGKFKVYSSITDYGVKFNWIIVGKRGDIDVEVDKNSGTLYGQGPYRWFL